MRVATRVVAGLVLLYGARAALAQGPAVSLPPAELARRLSGSTDSLSAAGRFSGVVLFARGDTILLEKAYGPADRAAGRANTVDTRFNLGSINKMFTGVAIQQLVLAGRISPDSTIAAYWPDYPNRAVARQVTIRQLLTHQAGLGGDIFGDPASRRQLRRLRDFLPYFVDAPLEFTPGSQTRYCNACFVVLGLLVERITGEDYYDYVREHVYAPAGMTATGHFPTDSLPPNTAIGYTNGRSDVVDLSTAWPNTDSLPRRGSSAGGGYSTAGDLFRYVLAAQARKIPGGPSGPRLGYAGGTDGVSAIVEAGMPGNYTLIVLANVDPPTAFTVVNPLHEWLGLAPVNAPK